MRSRAGPDKQGVYNMHKLLLHLLTKASAAKVIVPAVSMMSSMMIAVLPSMSQQCS